MQDKTTFPNNADSLAEYFRLHPEQAPDANVGNADLTASDVPTEIETAAAAGELAAPDEPNPLSEEMDAQPASDPLPVDPQKRLGIHYFADIKHYSQADLDRWMPVMQSLGVNWVTLPAPLDRAIPNEFISALIDAGIQPVVHLDLPLTEAHEAEDFAPMFRAYASWGVRYVALFDRPNLRAQWPGTAWTQRGLVARFLDYFVPMAISALEAGLLPVFPALEPGGDYWDTAFLRSALETLSERGEGLLLESLALGAYAWTGDNSMTWGAGGPESWPATLPYHTPDGSEDQRGFRIFDWYNAISRAALGKELPIIILAAGVQAESGKSLDAQAGKRAINMAETLEREASSEKNNAVPTNVLACNLWLLAADPASPAAHSAFFKINGKPTKVGEEWIAWRTPAVAPKKTFSAPRRYAIDTERAIKHYLLLPAAQEWPMDAVRSFLQTSRATVGTSEAEAAQAARVTLAGGLDAFSNELLRNLIQAGCTVEHLELAGA
ncbi:MAG: hypothetical protein WD751_10680 [Anaerolineales bacterium]